VSCDYHHVSKVFAGLFPAWGPSRLAVNPLIKHKAADSPLATAKPCKKLSEMQEKNVN